MNNFLLFEHEKQNENHYRVVDEERLNHLNNVLNKKASEEISICLVNESLGRGLIKNISATSVEIEIIEKNKGKRFPIKLVVAVSRPPTIKKILEHGTSLGVNEFHFYRPELTEKSFLEAKIFKEELFKKHLEYGLSQSKVYFKMPQVILHNSLPDLENFKDDQKFLLKMDAGKKFSHHPPQVDKALALVLGPERGLIPRENQYFEESGFLPIELVPSTLRVEIAAFSALSQLFLFQK